MRKFLRFLIAWAISSVVIFMMLPFFWFVDWLSDDDFDSVKHLFCRWLRWATFK